VVLPAGSSPRELLEPTVVEFQISADPFGAPGPEPKQLVEAIRLALEQEEAADTSTPTRSQGGNMAAALRALVVFSSSDSRRTARKTLSLSNPLETMV
jgi:hypothetical protein